MSISGYLHCHDCRLQIYLGTLRRLGRTAAYYRPSESDGYTFMDSKLNKALWKFFAEHSNHRIGILTEPMITDDMSTYAEIGGEDNPGSMSVDKYLEDWPDTST